MGTGLPGSEFIHASWIDGIRAEGRAQGLREAVEVARSENLVGIQRDGGNFTRGYDQAIIDVIGAIERLIGEPAPPAADHDPTLRDVHGIVGQIDLDGTKTACEVRLPPATVLGKGVSLRTVITGLQVRGMKVVLAGKPAP